MARNRNWCFVWNNYTDADIETAKSWTCKYVKFVKETAPTTGTPHLQGWISFASAKTWDAMKKWAPKELSFRAIKGSLLQNEEYVSKTQNEEGFWVFEKGEMPEEPSAQGKKESDRWAAALKAVQDNRLEDIPADILCRNLKQIEYAANRIKVASANLELWMVNSSMNGGTGLLELARARRLGMIIPVLTSRILRMPGGMVTMAKKS